MNELLVTTTEQVPGYRVVKTIGMVRGNTIRARHIGRDILALIKMLLGGEITDYTKMMGESREQALDRMLVEASGFGANAILDVRFSTSYVMGMAAEILVYGNAVTIEPDN